MDKSPQLAMIVNMETLPLFIGDKPTPYMLKKSCVSKPNTTPTILFGTTIMSQGATYELGVMPRLLTNVGIHGQIPASLMNNVQ